MMRANKVGRWVARTSVAVGLGAAITGTGAAVAAAWAAPAAGPAVRPNDASVQLMDNLASAKSNNVTVFHTFDFGWE